MIRDIFNIGITVILITFFGGLLFYYGRTNVQVDTIQENLTETLRVSVINNRDDSARVRRGIFILDRGSFETSFQDLFEKNTHIEIEDSAYTFEYLEDTANSDLAAIKAVRATIDFDGVKYKATSVVDVRGD